jgi:hypothetical protein
MSAAGAMSTLVPSNGFSSSGARSGLNMNGIQPSAIFAVCSIAFGPIAPR